MNNRRFNFQENGYTETIRKGLGAVRKFGSGWIDGTAASPAEQEKAAARLTEALAEADAVVVGAGAGLSTSAGFTYSGERFERYFFDFRERFGIRDMYSGGFYPFPDEETRWAWWARHIYFNRYVDPPKPVYPKLLELLRGKEYFVLTTNVDHQFQRAGFDKSRLFYTQGDYGLFQSASRMNRRTYDNEEWVIKAMPAERFLPDGNGVFRVPKDRQLSMRLPADLIPKCPDGSAAVMNLRSDDSFVEDEGWHRASAAYAAFLRAHEGERVLYLELGVGANTPVIVKYPFWAMTAENPKAVYACLNLGEAVAPLEIEKQSLCIDGDIGEILERLA